MYVCVCLAVTESEVESAIEGGAHTREAVTQACRAGGDCGACHGMIESKIEDHLEAASSGVVQGPGAPLAPAHDDLLAAGALVRGPGRAA